MRMERCRERKEREQAIIVLEPILGKQFEKTLKNRLNQSEIWKN